MNELREPEEARPEATWSSGGTAEVSKAPPGSGV